MESKEGVKFTFEDLKVYQKTLVFIDNVYIQTKQFPKSEQYQLTGQFQRAAVSIALNIAEGQGDSNPQFKRFLQIAKDSVNECVVCSTVAFRQGYINKEIDTMIRNQLMEISKMLNGLMNYLKK